MEAATPTRAGALRGCSGRRWTDRSQDWGGGVQLKRTLTEGQFWQAQVGEPKAAGGGSETTHLGHPPSLAINT